MSALSRRRFCSRVLRWSCVCRRALCEYWRSSFLSAPISATGWRGNPYRCLELARNGVVEGVTCIELLYELEEKLRAKLRLPEDHIVETLADLLGFLRLVTIANTLKVVAADPDDDKVMECALVADATHIVTRV